MERDEKIERKSSESTARAEDSRSEKSGRSARKHGTRYQRQFQQSAKAEEAERTAEQDAPKHSKLSFSEDERTPDMDGPKLTKAKEKSARMAERLEQAEKKLPTWRRLRMETVSDPEAGTARKKLTFEKEVKSQHAHLKGPLSLSPIKAGGNAAIGYAHRKVYQIEEENVGVKGAHRAELAAESGLRMAYHRHKTSPYRKVSKLQRKTAAAEAQVAYQQVLQDHPELEKNHLARLWQKKKLQRQYAKAAREAQKTGQRVKDTAVTTERITKRVVESVKRHPVAWGIVGLVLLLIFLIASVFASFSNIGTAGLNVITASSYLAEDVDLNTAELTYTEWETDLEIEIRNVESARPGYDEYRYQIDAIEHDPYILMSYLTALYQDFTYASVQGALRQLFESQYTLTYTEETEIRYRTEPFTDPETGECYEEEVPYEWHILNVQLSTTPMPNLIVSRMNQEQREICEVLLESKGNRQYVKNVFGTNWLPYVSSYYGYRVHPISGVKNYHTGIDIAMPSGTEILAGHDGTVMLAGEAGGYGLCVAIDGVAYKDYTLTTKYGHCSQVLVSVGQEVKAGDVIARVGSTGNSTGPHLHLEVLVDGQYLNPLYFAETGDTGSVSLPTAAGGGGSYISYDVPPEALADEQFAAMLTEAEKYLGYPYVWGGSSPSTSFDCSGYVSWVINHSGWNMGRLTAQGLLDACTPVTAANVKPGDLIFFQGTYDTSGASHVGIYVGGGMMIHCGNPISYASIETKYWTEHFYCFGRLP